MTAISFRFEFNRAQMRRQRERITEILRTLLSENDVVNSTYTTTTEVVHYLHKVVSLRAFSHGWRSLRWAEHLRAPPKGGTDVYLTSTPLATSFAPPNRMHVHRNGTTAGVTVNRSYVVRHAVYGGTLLLCVCGCLCVPFQPRFCMFTCAYARVCVSARVY